MSSGAIQHIGIIGSGNVAWHLAHHLKSEGLTIDWIFSRNEQTGTELASSLSTKYISSLDEVQPDLALICVNDDAIQSIISQLPDSIPMAYTSGTKPLKDLLLEQQEIGVFYPLQTFSKEKAINLFEVPFFIEAENPVFAQQLFDLAWKLSRSVQFASSEARKHLHLSAVMVNNFTNHLFYLANEYLSQHDLDWQNLKPLIQETVSKLDSLSPFEAQTGPARRKDQATIETQLALLEGQQKELYQLFTDSILKTYSNK